MSDRTTLRIFSKMKSELTLMPVKVNGLLHLAPNTRSRRNNLLEARI